MTKRRTYFELFSHLSKSGDHIQALIYVIANLLSEALKRICKQTPDTFQVKACLHLSENLSPCVKFLNRQDICLQKAAVQCATVVV